MIEPSAWVAIGAAASPSFSLDGRTLFHLRGSGIPQVWAMDRDGSNARPLAEQNEKAAQLRRAPNDDRLLWGIDAGGDECQQLWLLEPGSYPRALTASLAANHDLGAFSPDGAHIAFAANDRDRACFDIVVMDIATGKCRRLLEGPGARSVTNWSAHGLLVIGDRSSSDQSLSVVSPVDGQVREVPRPGLARYASARFARDGRSIFAITDHGGCDFMRLVRLDPETGATDNISAPPGRDIEAWSLSPDGASLATVENDRGYAILRVGPISGERPAIDGLPSGIVADLAWAPDSKTLAFCAQGPTTPPGIWLWELGAALAREGWQPDSLVEAAIDPSAMVPFDLVMWTSPDGTAVPGWFACPRGPRPKGGHPAIVWVHGGPAAQARANFRPDLQALLARGFAILMPNVRGSTGYGRVWMESDDFGNRHVALDDLVAGREWLARQPGIDPSRIGVMGQSYGGWMVLASITRHPDLWRAAVDYYGIADWFTLLRDTGPWRREHRALEYGIPGRHDDVLEEFSPIRRVGAVTAPLLIAHGDRDPRVPINESEQFSAAMALHQKWVRYERISYAGHGFIRPEHRRHVYTAVAEHFGQYL